MSDAIIVTKNISKTYDSGDAATTAIRDVSITIERGQFISIIGPSGSGKSTLLHIIGLLDQPTTGQYLIDGTDTKNIDEPTLARLRNETIGFIFQAFYLLPKTSVLENVMLPLQYSKLPIRQQKKRALDALERVQLSHRLHHAPNQLSGGEKQRTVIARALVTEPRLLLADEPTGNLDSATSKVIMELIDSLHQQGLSIIVITHETPTAHYAQRIITLRDGEVDKDVINTNSHQHFTK